MRRSLAGVATAATLATGCPGFFVGPDADLDRTALFEHVWRDFDRHYALFIVKGVDWDSLHDVYAPQAAQAATDGDLADVVGAMLLELQDIHVTLLVGLRRYLYRGFDSRPAFFDSAVVSANYVTDRRPAPNGQLHFGHAGPDVGYIWIPTFSGPGFAGDMDAALSQLGNLQALIVDVRDNPGGDLGNSDEIAGRFADRERMYAFVQLRDGPRHHDLTSRTPRTIVPAGARRFARPVVVLTNRRSTSAAESFVLAMRVLPTAVVVGDSTAGASGGTLGRELPNGWTYQFSWALKSTPDSTIYENVGLAPGVWVRGSAEELAAGRDAALDTALAVVRRALAANRAPSPQSPKKPSPGLTTPRVGGRPKWPSHFGRDGAAVSGQDDPRAGGRADSGLVGDGARPAGLRRPCRRRVAPRNVGVFGRGRRADDVAWRSPQL